MPTPHPEGRRLILPAWSDEACARFSAAAPHLPEVLLITGATGTIGRALLSALNALSDYSGRPLRLIGSSRRPPSAHWASLCEWIPWDVRGPHPRELADSVAGDSLAVVHTAADTRSHQMATDPAGVFFTCLDGTRHVLDAAVALSSMAFVNLSSVEVFSQDSRYGAPTAGLAQEDNLGDLPLSETRSCYPMGKRAAEHLCALYDQMFGMRTVSLRLGQTVGLGLPRHDPRFAASFLRQALAGEPIVLRTGGSSLVHPVDTEDVVAAILTVLSDPDTQGPYTVVNPSSICTVRAFADQVSSLVGSVSRGVLVRPEPSSQTGFAPPVTRLLSSDRLIQSTAWRPSVSFQESIRRTVLSWQDSA